MEDTRSTVCFQSNIQKVKDTGMVYDDARFMNSITDARALEYIKSHIIDPMRGNNFRQFSSYQRAIYDRVCKKCSYAKNEVKRPIGIRRDANSKTIIVNRCEEWDCQEIGKCRKDLAPAYIAEKLKELELIQAELEEQENPGMIADDMDLEIEKQPVANLILPDEISEPAEPDETNSYEEEDAAAVEADEDVQIFAAEADEVHAEEAAAVGYESDDDMAEPDEDVADYTERAQADFHEKLAECVQVEQSDYLDSDNRQWWLINSGPGTGKTELLAQRIAKLMYDGVDLENVLILCYSRAARDVVKARVFKYAKENNLLEQFDSLDIRTIDSFCGYLTSALKDELDILPDKKIKNSYDRNVDLAKRILEEQPDLLGNMQYFITDEIQDLVGIRAEMILTILKCLDKDSCGVTLLGDYCQAIYDYAVEHTNGMPSCDFYQQLSMYENMQWAELAKNHRMGDDMVARLSGWRKSLEQDSYYGVWVEAGCLEGEISLHGMSVSCEAISQDDLPKGTLAIITKSNAQALRISNALGSIRHRLLLDRQGQKLPGWVADIFIGYKGERIDKERYEECFRKILPAVEDEDRNGCWSEFCRLMDIAVDKSCEVSDLLLKLEEGAKHRIAFLKDFDDCYDITVSCVHRVKGREYDNVLLLKDLFFDVKKIDDVRALYVAITRSRESIGTILLERKKYWQTPEAHNRATSWAGAPKENKGKRRRIQKARKGLLNDFQFLPDVDLVWESFAKSDTQKNIQNIEDMDSYFMEIVMDNTSTDIKYLLVDADNHSLVYAKLSDTFANDFKILYEKSVKDESGYKFDEQRDYPTRFTGLVAKRKVSLIGQLSGQQEGIKDYNGVSIWYGLEPEGLLTPMWDDMY